MNVHRLISHAGMYRIALLFGLLLAFGIARPIQIQAQTSNPASVDACGLPLVHSSFTSAATVKTFNMTADCTLPSGVPSSSAVYSFSSGTFNINGNGHSIILSNHAWAIQPNNTGVVNVSNVTFRGANQSDGQVIWEGGGRLNLTDVIFRDNMVSAIMYTHPNGRVDLMNVQFLNNSRADASDSEVIEAYNTLNITNVIFSGNRGYRHMIRREDGTTTLDGCLTASDNLRADGGMEVETLSGAITDNTTGVCWPNFTPPRKKKKADPTPTPTSTPRPQIAATHVALQAATGATFRPTYGLDSGVHFRQLDGAGIGVQSLIDAGFLEAFDVWGYVEQGVEVCFPQVGRVVFLDASTSPRAIVPLESTVANGQTCVSISSPGSLVLLPN